MEKRSVWADFARVLAIYFVLVIHSSNITLTGGSSEKVNLMVFLLANTGVPIFVILSGHFLLQKHPSYSDFFKNRLTKILIPWFFWAALLTLANIFFAGAPAKLSGILSLYWSTILSFWFMPMIFGLYAVTPLLTKMLKGLKSRDLTYLIILWFLIVSVMPYARNTLAFPLYTDDSILRQVINFSGFYLAGYWFYINKKLFKQKHFLFFLIIAAVSLAFTYLKIAPPGAGALENGAYIFYHSPGNIILSLSLFSAVFCLRDLFSGMGYFTFLSKLAYGIFLAHPLIIFFLNRLPENIFSFKRAFLFNGLFNALVLFILSGLTVFIVQKLTFKIRV